MNNPFLLFIYSLGEPTPKSNRKKRKRMVDRCFEVKDSQVILSRGNCFFVYMPTFWLKLRAFILAKRQDSVFNCNQQYIYIFNCNSEYKHFFQTESQFCFQLRGWEGGGGELQIQST